ncbi:MAG: hypothetical protein AMXMBFR82_07010 [Candidatus Hydrogenedentota bacterium]
MATLTRAHDELFRRAPDTRFASLDDLHSHCDREKKESMERWVVPEKFRFVVDGGYPRLAFNGDMPHTMSDWSFSQVCRMAEVQKDTVNRLTAETASRVLMETLPRGSRPIQAFSLGESLRSIHGVSYRRLYNADLLNTVREHAVGFSPPQVAANGGTGLYCGEQDMFCFLVDPTGWVEIENEAFAPGFFLWNSEVGRRSVGIQSFWFQAVCQNHIVWDAIPATQYHRKHTANVDTALDEIRETIDYLVSKRDERRDRFVRIVQQAMNIRLDDDLEETLQTVQQQGFSRSLANAALEAAQRQGALTLFSLIDALTRLSQERHSYAGDRADADERAGKLLALAA